MAETRKQQKIQKWELLVQERLDSGLSVKKFCEANGYTENMYYHWVNAIHKADPDFDTNNLAKDHETESNVLVEIKPADPTEMPDSSSAVSGNGSRAPAAVIRSGTLEIDLFPNADTPFLQHLLEAVHCA